MVDRVAGMLIHFMHARTYIQTLEDSTTDGLHDADIRCKSRIRVQDNQECTCRGVLIDGLRASLLHSYSLYLTKM